jgi:hypothetical protein
MVVMGGFLRNLFWPVRTVGLGVVGKVGAAIVRIGGAEKKAIQSFRLRLHSGLRQQGGRLRRGWFMARLKPSPTEWWRSWGG